MDDEKLALDVRVPDVETAPVIQFFVPRPQESEGDPYWVVPGKERQTLQKVSRQALIADLVAKGWSYNQIATMLGVSQSTVSGDMREMVTALGQFAGRTVEEWTTSQLLILEDQIRQTLLDAGNDDPKVRNMARRSLVLLLKQQDQLLKLSARRVEVEVNQHIEFMGMDLTGLLPPGITPKQLAEMGLIEIEERE